MVCGPAEGKRRVSCDPLIYLEAAQPTGCIASLAFELGLDVLDALDDGFTGLPVGIGATESGVGKSEGETVGGSPVVRRCGEAVHQ